METSKSLLIRAKQDRGNEAWFKLVNIYQPLISGWLRRAEIPETDVLDLTQDVLLALSTQLAVFNHNGRTGAFRSWLRKISANRVRRHWARRKKQVPLAGSIDHANLIEMISDPESELSKKWEQEHDRHVLEKILQFIALEFDEVAMEAFCRIAIREEPARTISRDLKISVGQVYKFKYRVMKRLLEEASGLVDTGNDTLSPTHQGLLSSLLVSANNMV